MDKNEHKLPLFYQQQSDDDLLDNSGTLKEFIVCCLLDPKFPGFVSRVEQHFTDILLNESDQN